MSLAEKIPNVRKGSAPSLLNAELANKLINKVNALTNITVTRSSYDSVVIGSDGITITLQEIPDEIESTGGGFLNAEPVEMWVCINGEARREKIFIESDPE